jgi:transcriptional regulator with XRE-family HTH domain
VPNHTLKAIRLALRMSQSEFASAVRNAGNVLGEPNTCNKRLVQKWESGEHTECRPNYKRALQAVTRTPYEQLGFSGAPVPAVDAPLLTGRLAGLIQQRTVAPDQVLVGLAGEPGERLRFALERPNQADNDAMAIVEANTARLFALEHHRASRLIVGTVNRHIDDVSGLLAGTRREPLRRRLAASGGQSAALAGWLAFDRGDAASAHRYWDSALAAARYASDGPLLACVLTYLSYSSAERGDPATAWQLAHTAISHAGPDARARSWMAARAAEEAAQLGERSAALAELEIALSLGSDLPKPVPGDDTLPWTRFFDAKRLASMAANVHGRLGDASAAMDAAEWALRVLGEEQVKVRAIVLAEVACAAARVGQLDVVARTAFEAADLADALEATLARRKLRALLQLLGPYRTSVVVRRLVDRLDVLE